MAERETGDEDGDLRSHLQEQMDTVLETSRVRSVQVSEMVLCMRTEDYYWN